MALGRRGNRTGSMFIAATDLPQSGGHPFYRALNRLLEEANFDRIVEEMCEEAYADHQGRPSIPPGVYFRMYFVGYFEGIDSQRGIAWRCNDSLALREFLGLGLDEKTPDHSSLTVIRKRLSTEIHETVFALVLGIAQEKALLKGKTLGVDATVLEANAAMKSIVRKDSGEDWKEYLRRLAQDAGIENPTDEDARRFDKKRGSKKKVSNDDWRSPSDPDSRIAKMKDGRTHMAYKAEHAVDLDSQLIVAATIQHADRSDTESLAVTIAAAQETLATIEHETAIEEVVADKGYHSNAALVLCAEAGLRTYTSPKQLVRRRR
jgi:transposase